MSVARVHTVDRARKDQGHCGKCGDAIPAGSPYRWFSVGFRSHYKQKRCMKQSCYPKTSELESSLLSGVYAAQEGAALPEDPEDDTSSLSDALNSVAEAANEVADQYEEADEAMGGHQGENYEKAESLREYASELEGWQAPDDSRPDDGCDAHDEETEGCEACADKVREWWQEQVDSAQEALDSLSL
jgi:hypothetical protein